MSSRSRVALRAFVIAGLAAALTLGADLEHGRPAPAPAAAVNGCDVATLPSKPVDALGGLLGVPGPDEVCDEVTDKVTGAVGNAVGDVASQVGGSIVEELAKKAGEGAIWLMGRAKQFALESTSPDVLDPSFTKKYEQMFALALVPALIMLLIVAVECVARSDTGLLARTALVTTPVAMAAAAAAMAVVQLLIAGVDSMSQGISADAGAEMGRFMDRAGDAIGATVGIGSHAGGSVAGPAGAVGGAVAGAAVPIFIALVGAVLAVIAALILWLELLFRAAAIYAVALFVPFAVIGVIWPRARAWMTRTVELILVLVFSKFVIVAILSLSGTLIVDAGDFAVVLQASMLMLLAAFSPLVLLKLVPFVESAAHSVTPRSSGSLVFAGMQNVSNGQRIHSIAQRNWDGGSGGANVAAGGGTAATADAASVADTGFGAAGAAGAITVAKSAKGLGERAGESLEEQSSAPRSGGAPRRIEDLRSPEIAPLEDPGPPRPAPGDSSTDKQSSREEPS
jgi:hypothetical protein